MKKKLSKRTWTIICVATLVVAVTITAVAVSPLELFNKKYDGVKSEEEMIERLSRSSVSEIFDEVNTMGMANSEVAGYMYHASALLERLNEIPEELLLRIVENEKNNVMLRVLTIQLLDYENEDGKRLLKDVSRFEKILLNEKEDSEVRQQIAITLSDEKSNDVLEKVLFQTEDNYVGLQCLARLESNDRERGTIAAYKIIDIGEINKKLHMAVRVVSNQMVNFPNSSVSDKERDEWVAYLMGFYEKFEKESEPSEDLFDICSLIVFCLEDMYYKNAIYEILRIDDEFDGYKWIRVEANYQVLKDVLEKNPTDKDIEMIIEAMTIYPLVEVIEPLKVAVKNSKSSFDLKPILSQEAQSVDEIIVEVYEGEMKREDVFKATSSIKGD
ncbi:MAG: hypothetical protein FWG82_00970 [Oscillospiraceae bacterium]|nr:hypothetical protein [Oscillospiraceae bacterium]